ncbi:uncharacterized protein LOC114277763 [Camellia sinensis]|uniref:uncharacterized protein LOC114277763 n=1 Tax=Camellia sinensis TaxID=4442 RepID=UPI0010360B90|nr:uncharacterized protein LOC114277763 [Camellia sinensis]
MEPITFTGADCTSICYPHDDPLVISALLSNYKIRRVLVDNGSSSDIIFLNAYRQLKVGKESLSPFQTPLVDFTRDRVTSIGSIDLPIIIREYPQQTTKLLTFLVVNCPSTYNIILGRTALNIFQAVTSTFHLAMKFPTDLGVGTVRGEQTMARGYYVASLKEVKPKEAMIIEGLDVRDEDELVRGEPVEELVEVFISPADPTKTAKIGSQLSSQAKADLTALLIEHNDVFAWTHSDMPGIDPSFITHRLGIEPHFRPFRQKQFMVRKNDSKWRLCIDYSDLNRACPKDSYPLPHIDMLVNATAGHQMLSYMDAFSGYNKILIHQLARNTPPS